MKQELYHYAVCLKAKILSNFPNVCAWILLTIFLVPLLLSNIWIGLVILCLYLLLYLCSRREIDKYNKELLKCGLFLLFLGIEFSSLLLVQYEKIQSLVITIFASTISYEIFWFIKIKRKMYSQGRQIKPWTRIMPFIFGGSGVWFGKVLAKSENTDFILWLMILVTSLLITYSISFFQKYFILKIINK